jgi:hypothetical protein
MGIVLSLVTVALRVVVATIIAVVLAVPLSLVYADGSFIRSFGIACVAVGSLALLMTFGGSSPSRRIGVQDPWFASFFPGLMRPMGEQYSRTRLSDSAVFALTGLALLALGVALL